MIITRTPLRISLGGGGTDLPSFYRNFGHGYLIAAAITKYIYISAHHNFDQDILLKYSQIERAQSIDEVSHPILRECLREAKCSHSIEISSMADIPTGTGLGSSGSFTVGVLNALDMYQHVSRSSHLLAETASDIEMNRLKEPVGKQDQYIAAYGGITAFTFYDDETVRVEPLPLDQDTRSQIEENLMLFYTGVRRSASEVLADEQSRAKVSNVRISDNLELTRSIGYETSKTLLQGDTKKFGQLLTQQWKLKYERQQNEVHDMVDCWIDDGIRAGALGGKLVGAGGGGFLLFYAEQKTELRRKMREHGLTEVSFGIDYEGSTVIVAK